MSTAHDTIVAATGRARQQLVYILLLPWLPFGVYALVFCAAVDYTSGVINFTNHPT